MDKISMINFELNLIVSQNKYIDIEHFAESDGQTFFQCWARLHAIGEMENLADEINEDGGFVDFRFFLDENKNKFIKVSGVRELSEVEIKYKILHDNAIRFYNN